MDYTRDNINRLKNYLKNDRLKNMFLGQMFSILSIRLMPMFRGHKCLVLETNYEA